MPKVTFTKKGAFYHQLKTKVDLYFIENNLKKTGNWNLYFKTIVLTTSAVVLYSLLLSVELPIALSLLLCLLLGFTFACIGFNIMHDACHGSYSSKPWMNEVLGFSLNALGGNSFIWKCKHHLHHTYTNVEGIDDDIAKSPLLRQCTSQKWVPIHRYQHFYIVFVYAISSIAWITIMDFEKYFKQKVFTTPLRKMNLIEHFIFWISKSLFLLFYVLIPIYFVGAGPWAIGFVFAQVAMGYTLALVFQMAHVVEGTEFETVDVEPKLIEKEWAIHQVISTANFATNNPIVSWFVGGLNFQIEHHLFPRISHIHYPAISNIVKLECEEFNLPYNNFSTVSKAMASHYSHIKKLGRKPDHTDIEKISIDQHLILLNKN